MPEPENSVGREVTAKPKISPVSSDVTSSQGTSRFFAGATSEGLTRSRVTRVVEISEVCDPADLPTWPSSGAEVEHAENVDIIKNADITANIRM
ncbi:hypothetical protein ACWFPY_36645 [Nocardia fluminea]